MSSSVAGIDPWSRQICKAFMLFAVVLLGFPVPIEPLAFAIDPAWMAGINWATAHQLVFGRDVIFTYGPLGFALFPVDCATESWRAIAILSHMCLFGFWWLSVGLVLAHIEDLEGGLLFASSSLLATRSVGAGGILTLTVLGYLTVSLRRNSLALALLAAFLSGLSIFIKFNLGVLCVATVCAWIMLIVYCDPWKPAAVKSVATLATLSATILAVHLALGGGLGDLARFVWYSTKISADYSSQMSIEGPLWPTIYMLAVLAVMAAYSLSGAVLGWKSWSTAAITIIPIFFEYKRAITRMDTSYWISGVVGVAAMPAFLLVVNAEKHERERIRWLVAMIMFVGFVTTTKYSTSLAAACLVTLIVLWMVARAVWFFPGERLLERMRAWAARSALLMMVAATALLLCSLILPGYPASIKLMGVQNVLKLLHLKSSLAIRPEVSPHDDFQVPQSMIAAIGQDSVDVYPWRISIALINGLKYSPRFLFQSYQAYSPPLDARCADHFRGPGSPKFILYSYGLVDSLHQSIVDPLTWLEIYRWYDVTNESPELLLLRRRGAPRWQDSPRPLGESRIKLGERWEVPKGRALPIVLKARLDLTAAGSLVRILYRVIPPRARIEYDDGTVGDYRLVWLNARSGFLVSDLPRDLAATKSFFQRGVGNRVRAVTFLGDPRYFRQEIQLQWEELPLWVGNAPET